MDVRLTNVEVTPDGRNVLVHAEVRNPLPEPAIVYWQDFCQVVTCRGEALRPPTDAGVDSGTGLHRVFGSYQLGARAKARMLIYFPLDPAERPVRLRIADGRLTEREYR
ncbi:MAG: hypothetical protein AB1758_16250 [Candidatus Eremiobacterota bacterium]